MIKTYTDGATIVAILEVDPMPSYTFGPDSSKIRYKEPYVSEAQDLKDSGIIPVGIYNGYTPVAVGGNNLSINVDVARGDSVAVVETRTGKYNLTVRTTSNVLLEDFTGVAFPALVILRTEYSLTTSPLAGMTSSKILVVDPAIDDSDPTHLNTGDVRLCRVTGIGGGGVVNFTTVITTDRTTTGGPLATQNQLSSIGSSLVVGPFSSGAGIGAPAVVTGSDITFTAVSAQKILCNVTADCPWDVFGRNDTSLFIDVDGVFTRVSRFACQFGSFIEGNVSGTISPTLLAGTHTIRAAICQEYGFGIPAIVSNVNLAILHGA